MRRISERFDHGGSIQRLLRNARGLKNSERRRDPERISQAGAKIPSGRREGQSQRRGEVQTDQRGLRSPERPGEAEEIRPTWRELESAWWISAAARLGGAPVGRRILPLWWRE